MKEWGFDGFMDEKRGDEEQLEAPNQEEEKEMKNRGERKEVENYEVWGKRNGVSESKQNGEGETGEGKAIIGKEEQENGTRRKEERGKQLGI
ncbi:hypothetical protein NDU88_004507 [Pleurodeles waltl]|uniref:Uncharacterized protein n=1 Tax=Pleurodeles waltl TaxID=8319 RepID=A0AAV7MUR9_PLEWA|nr:hypothetical protein NDU88_004507 [Pleurodeles waltl]